MRGLANAPPGPLLGRLIAADANLTITIAPPRLCAIALIRRPQTAFVRLLQIVHRDG